MDEKYAANLKSARHSAGLTQESLALRSGVVRLRIARAELGQYVPRLDEATKLARVLRIPLEQLVDGRTTPPSDFRGIAVELNHLGVSDLEVHNSVVPGSFRHPEEVLVLALAGDRPEPRVVEAIPTILARQKFHAVLVDAFTKLHDRRVKTRLAWLSDVTLTLGKAANFPIPIETEPQLREFIQLGEKAEITDSLGHPATGNVPPAWRRWNINYAGTMQDFLRRAREIVAARGEL